MSREIIIRPRLDPKVAAKPVAERARREEQAAAPGVRRGARIRKALALKGRRAATTALRRSPLRSLIRVGPALGIVAAGAAVAGVARAVTGRDFSGIASALNAAAFDGQDAEARASATVRGKITADLNVRAFANTETGRAQLAEIYSALLPREIAREKGINMFNEDPMFDTKNTLDLVFDRLEKAVAGELGELGFFDRVLPMFRDALLKRFLPGVE